MREQALGPELVGGVAASETSTSCVSKRSVPELFAGTAVHESTSKCVSKRAVPELFAALACVNPPTRASLRVLSLTASNSQRL